MANEADHADASVIRHSPFAIRHSRDLLVLLAFILPVLLFFADPLLNGRVFQFRDFSRFFHPNWHYAVERLRQGQLPLWNPYCDCGHPFLAAWNTGALYPLSLIYIVGPFSASLKWFVALHSYFALAMMYLLARDVGCRRPAAVVAALAFGLSGFVLSAVDNPNTLTSLAWMPLVFMLVRRAVHSPSARRIAAAGAAVALQVYASGPEPVYCTWLVVGLWGLGHVLTDGRGWARRIGVLAACLALGIGLSAAQLVPFAELLQNSRRGGSGYLMNKSNQWAVPPRDLLRFVVPDYLTNTTPMGYKASGEQLWMKSFYLGLVPLALAGIALARVRARRVLFLAGVTALGVLLSMGDQSLFWVGAYYALPGVAGIRYPVKFMMIPTFSLALLAGLGADWLLRADERSRRRTLLAAALAALVVLAAVGVGTGVVGQLLAAKTDAAGRPLEALESIFIDALRNTRLSLVRTLWALAATGACLAALALLRRRWRQAAAVALGLILVADSYHQHRPQVFTGPARMYRIRPASLDVLERPAQPARIFIEPHLVTWLDAADLNGRGEGDPLFFLREVQTHNLPLISHVQSATGFVPVRPARFEALIMRLGRRAVPHEAPLVNFLNVRTVIYAPTMVGKPWLDAIRFEANPDALPRATILREVLRDVPAPEAEVRPAAANPQASRAASSRVVPRRPPDPDPELSPKDQTIVEYLTSPQFDPRRVVYFEDPPPPLPVSNPGPQSPDRVDFLTYEPERVVMRVDAAAPGYLVVADQYFPGWRATLNGAACPIARADYCFRAVAVPAGVSTVEMRYRPRSLTLGFAVTALSVLVVLGLLVASRRRGKGGVA